MGPRSPDFEARTPAFRAQCQAGARWACGAMGGWPRPGTLGGHPADVSHQAPARRVASLEDGHPSGMVAQRDEQWWLTDTEAGEHGPFDVVVLAFRAPGGGVLARFQRCMRRSHRWRCTPYMHSWWPLNTKHPPRRCCVRWRVRSSSSCRTGSSPDARRGHLGGAPRPSWSQARLQEPPASLRRSCWGVSRCHRCAAPGSCMVHRWRFAHASEDGAFEALHWWEPASSGNHRRRCAGRGVEAAWCSGSLAERVQGSIGLSPASVTTGPASGEGQRPRSAETTPKSAPGGSVQLGCGCGRTLRCVQTPWPGPSPVLLHEDSRRGCRGPVGRILQTTTGSLHGCGPAGGSEPWARWGACRPVLSIPRQSLERLRCRGRAAGPRTRPRDGRAVRYGVPARPGGRGTGGRDRRARSGTCGT